MTSADLQNSSIPDSIRIRARIEVLTPDQGGRSAPFTTKFRPNHNFDGPNSKWFYIGQLEIREGDWVYPGDTRELEIKFLNVPGLPEILTPGRRWLIQEGARLIANAEVLSVLPET